MVLCLDAIKSVIRGIFGWKGVEEFSSRKLEIRKLFRAMLLLVSPLEFFCW